MPTIRPSSSGRHRAAGGAARGRPARTPRPPPRTGRRPRGEQLPVGVRVDVARGADEVGHVGPPGCVALGDLDRVAQQLLLGLGPQLAERSSDSSPCSRRVVCARCSKRFIATWRNTVAIEPSMLSARSESRDAGDGGLVEQATEHERLAEHARGLGERQRRGEVEHALGRRARRARRGPVRGRALARRAPRRCS